METLCSTPTYRQMCSIVRVSELGTLVEGDWRDGMNQSVSLMKEDENKDKDKVFVKGMNMSDVSKKWVRGRLCSASRIYDAEESEY